MEPTSRDSFMLEKHNKVSFSSWMWSAASGPYQGWSGPFVEQLSTFQEQRLKHTEESQPVHNHYDN